MTDFSALQALLPQVMAADFHPFSRRLRELQQKPDAGKLATLTQQIEASAARRARRTERLPQPDFPEELPVSGRRDEILAAILKHQVVIVAGETGSGKTTQLPKIALAAGRGAAGLIGCTQPRRIAARNVASRIAFELKSPLGEMVGYQVRFQDKSSADSLIKVMTDGILLAETQTDRFLNRYDTLIIDEAHERSLNIDFLLGYLKQLLPRRPDLKVIVTSATIDTQRFASHFSGAPIIEVSGRTYPVEVRYRPLKAKEGEAEQADMEDAIVDAVHELSRHSRDGDILVFLPGEREIREAAEALRKNHPAHTEILPLFARQSAEEQQRVFASHTGRRIVLSTNVAETSLTVPGIRYVVDTGLARIKRYSHRNKVDQLLVEPISQASANQRAGRCGRVAAGICIRLYDELEFKARPAFTDPEILRTSLAGTLLRMHDLKLGDIEQFPFLEAPTPRMVNDGYQLLDELGAMDEQRRITPVGRELARLPLDPKVARMLLASKQENCLQEMLVIASALSTQDPRVRPQEFAGSADAKHKLFQDERSDFLGWVKLWQAYNDALVHQKSRRQLQNWCQDHFLAFQRMREWRDLHGQLATQVAELGWQENDKPATLEQIHRALIAGLAGNIGVKSEEGHYQGARGSKFQIFPGSALAKKTPKWVLAAELTETGKLFARTVAKIEPEWVEAVVPHLLKRHYYDPHWEKTTQQVAAFERTTLYGLTLNPKRRVSFGSIDPKTARELYIRHALVLGEIQTQAPFLAHNRKLIDDIRELEHKSRRQDVLVDEDKLYAFFDERLPQDIANTHSFEKWRREAEKQNPKLLFLKREDLMRHEAEHVTADLFPDTLDIAGTACKLTYRFEPGHALDGVTLNVPLALLNRVEASRIDWLVLGLVREKIHWLLKSLPKQYRRVCVPVPEFTTRFLQRAEWGKQTLIDALTEFIRKETQTSVPREEWASDVPDHLRMHIRVVDDAGKTLASARDLAQLQAEFGSHAQESFADAGDTPFDKSPVTQWDIGDLPASFTFTRGKTKLTGYPALADEDGVVALRLFDTEEAATESHREGVRRLLALQLKEQMKQLDKQLASMTQLYLQARALADADSLREDLLACITDRAFIGEDELPRDAKAFNNLKDRARTRLPAVSQAVIKITTDCLSAWALLQPRLLKAPPPLAADLKEQLGQLVFKGFLSATPWQHLTHLPRYLAAMHKRLDKYPGNAERDGKHTASLKQWQQQFSTRQQALRKSGQSDPRLTDFYWMLQELRVSLFAQELKTPYPVSFKRIEKAWNDMR